MIKNLKGCFENDFFRIKKLNSTKNARMDIRAFWVIY